MRFERIVLENFKSHERVDLRFDTGVTVIHGVNGSGKSSLLEACFFGLYGTKALDGTLDEVVTIGADELTVELWFTHDGASYHVEREVVVRNGRARTKHCVLEGPDGPIEGATDVRNRIASLLRMDTEAFVNCAYVRQGEVNKLINASPGVRQDMLDDLLQLGTLEHYRERASEARVGVGRVRDDKRGALAEIEEQIEDKIGKNLHEKLNELQTDRADVDEQRDRYEQNRENARETREEARTILSDFEEKQSELESVEADIRTVRERIQSTVDQRNELRTRIDRKSEAISGARERREELLERVDGIDDEFGDEGAVKGDDGGEGGLEAAIDAELESLRERLDEITENIREVSVETQEYESKRKSFEEAAETRQTQATQRSERASTLEEELETALEELEEKRTEVATVRSEIESTRETFSDEPIDVGEATGYRDDLAESLSECRQRRAELEAELEAERARLADATSLLEAGKCPECGQPVDESPHVHTIDDREAQVASLEETLSTVREREEELEDAVSTAETLVERESTLDRLANDQENLLDLIGERARTVRDKQSRVERLRSEANEDEAAAEEKREKAAEAEAQISTLKERIATFNRDKSALSDRLETLESLADVVEELEQTTTARARLREQREEKKRVNDERRERLEALRARRDDLQESFDEKRIERAREKKAEAEEYLEAVGKELHQLEARRDELQGKIGGIQNELRALEALQDRRESLEETLESLESLYEEATRLQELYGHLRAELREQNVETLERMLNETFELVYENDTYAHIELDGDYRLTVYQKDGEPLDPEQLSGGERALFNLSLRCAIYRLLAEGIEGTAPMPPLILDEPTVFLDASHVSKLLELIDVMYELGVAQILVVSHDDELVAAADDLVTVRKDATTNRSSIERRPGSPQSVVMNAED